MQSNGLKSLRSAYLEEEGTEKVRGGTLSFLHPPWSARLVMATARREAIKIKWLHSELCCFSPKRNGIWVYIGSRTYGVLLTIMY